MGLYSKRSEKHSKCGKNIDIHPDAPHVPLL